MTARIRSSCLKGFISLTDELGGEPRQLITAAGIDCDRLNDEDYFFPFADFIQLLSISASRLDCSDFGLRLAGNQDQEILGPVAFLALASTDVREIINSVGQFLYHYTPAITLSLKEGERSYAHLDFTGLENADYEQIIEHTVGCTYNIISLLTNGLLKPLTVKFRHSMISKENQYQDIFKCPVLFNQHHDAIELDARCLELNLSSKNPALHKLVSNYLSMVEIESDAAPHPAALASHQARHLIKRLLPTGQVTRDLVSENMNTHGRSLHRKLQSEGYTFDSLVDEIRKDEASKLIKHKDIPMSQIAGALGYSEQSSFNRAFKRWFGMTPKKYIANKNPTKLPIRPR
ncbi:AraC-like DNA-binding protein [Zhongshania antarctica]|jgi:AraC-like DNA-binding protein|uniref:AraC-like DNA-binding protein n=1 Tax=Zhongshania antarctica TaxID=641702 RepID=A0A840R9R9_9GAMM|nr:AraC family transcriptional regulator [Zhongshania antarctica]MBB5189206.1 AraC-like DNA-binding protein [Zhongshania antarctica]